MQTIQHENRRPAYLQLYERLKGQIIGGVYNPGQRLPSKRALADEAGVSIVTAQHALDLLCQEGYAVARERSGVYAALSTDGGLYAGPAAPAAPAAAPPAVTLPDSHFPMSVLARHMRRTLSDYDGRILQRAPNGGCPELCAALSAYLRRSRQIDVRPEQIIVGAGAEYLYGLIVTLLGRERLYAVEHPSYAKITRVYQANDVRLEPLPLAADGIASAALAASAASVLHVTPYRSFPSGVTASASKRHEYIAWADAPDRYLIEDDYSSEFSVSGKPEDTLFAMRRRENVIYVNTFSMTIAPALRAGYMLLPETLLPQYQARAGFYACAVPVFEQLVLASLLDSGDFERHIRRIRRKLRAEARPWETDGRSGADPLPE